MHSTSYNIGKSIFGVMCLIILQRKTPERLTFYQVMMRRSQYPEEYMQLHEQAKYGYIGELRLDREWKDVGLAGMLFHDFTCFNEANHPHQMDTIFVCKHFVLVVEVKYIAGRIQFNPSTRQLVRVKEDGRVEAFPSPIDQVKRHRLFLQNHFMMLPDTIPVEAAVVMTNPSCVIEHTDDEIPMFMVNGLRTVLERLTKRYQHIHLNTRLIRTTLEQLYQPHTEQAWRKVGPIKTGVLCLICNEKMVPGNKGFKCLHCNATDSNHSALRRTLFDYRVLFGPEISNRKFREFAEITSPNTAYGILTRLVSERKGAKRNSVYIIPENIFQHTYL